MARQKSDMFGGGDGFAGAASGDGKPAGQDVLSADSHLLRENSRLKQELAEARDECKRLKVLLADKEEHREMIKQDEVFHQRYWTPEEHQRFLTGLKMYGHKDIKAISRFVGTRNATQVRAPLYLRGARHADTALYLTTCCMMRERATRRRCARTRRNTFKSSRKTGRRSPTWVSRTGTGATSRAAMPACSRNPPEFTRTQTKLERRARPLPLWRRPTRSVPCGCAAAPRPHPSKRINSPRHPLAPPAR